MFLQFFKKLATVSFMFNGSNASLNNKVNTIYDNSTSLTAGVINKDNIINCDYTYGSDGKITHTITSEYFDCENYSYRGSNSNNVSLTSDDVELNTDDSELELKNIVLNNDISLASTLVDNRVKITNPTDYPYCTYGYLYSSFKFDYITSSGATKEATNSYVSSSFLVGSNLLITAAHCVYGDETIGKYDDSIYNPEFCYDITIYFCGTYYAETSYDKCFRWSTKIKSVHIPIEYYQNESNSYDWAIIELDTNLGDTLGYSTLLPNWYEEGYSITSYGYPGDKRYVSTDYTQLYKTSGKINKMTDDECMYVTDAYATHGQSGSPLIAKVDGKAYVIGILMGITDTGTYAIKINNLIYYFIKSYTSGNGPYLYIDVMNKENKIWYIRVSNYTDDYIQFYYNSKMCYFNDAKNWSNLNDVSYASFGGKTSLVVQIKENWFATSIAVSYIKDNTRYITYANNLNSNGFLTTYYNSIGV